MGGGGLTERCQHGRLESEGSEMVEIAVARTNVRRHFPSVVQLLCGNYFAGEIVELLQHE